MQRLLRQILVIAFITIVLGVTLVGILVVGIHTDKAARGVTRDQNAIWLEHAWIEVPFPEEALQRLGQTLTTHQIKYAYVHAGPFEEDGSIPPERIPQASTFLATMNEQFPQIEWYAWVGQLRNKLDLENKQVRSTVVATIQHLIKEKGFEGIHLNIEPMIEGDQAFLNLLRETRLTLPNTPLSIAVDEWQPTWLSNLVGEYLDRDIVSYSSSQFFKKVMPLVNQVVVMGYDTSLTSAAWYRWFLEQQVIYMTQFARRTQTDVLIGIPTYDGTPAQREAKTFNPEVENIKNALRGVSQGLSNLRTARERFKGVALYAYWEMDAEEWEIYREDWLGPLQTP